MLSFFPTTSMGNIYISWMSKPALYQACIQYTIEESVISVHELETELKLVALEEWLE